MTVSIQTSKALFPFFDAALSLLHLHSCTHRPHAEELSTFCFPPTLSTHSNAFAMQGNFNLYIRFKPSSRHETIPASRNTERCFEMFVRSTEHAQARLSSISTSSLTLLSPALKVWMIASLASLAIALNSIVSR
ncbi:MAG: hypothetical protein NT061_00170 [Spirochaetes bacterium]|nr:hypothetical protein [Spirochaetota bacterium]